MTQSKCIVWFRHDLRLDDHIALSQAVKNFDQSIPVYIYSQEDEGDWPLGGASRWWLHHALQDLDQQLEKKGSYLVRKKGRVLKALKQVIEETGASALYFNRRYEPSQIQLEQEIHRQLSQKVEIKRFRGNLLYEPDEIFTQSGKPYQVYTPFWNACKKKGAPPKPLEAPSKIESPSQKPHSDQLESLHLLPKISWDEGFYKAWNPTRAGADQRCRQFFDGKVEEYHDERDVPAEDGTSRLSPYLHFGQISARRLWHEIQDGYFPEQKGKLQFMKEIHWREFAQHLLVHFPNLPDSPLRPEFKKFPWKKNTKALKAWQTGKTGYPLVDAGMRQLYATGWMHNRVRMVVASFLVKHLLISWEEGARWFWDTLVDADLGSNTLGWQWAGGCGPDAAPYFRIFNPILQSQRFDSEGLYIKQWVPELSPLKKSQIHEPWEITPLDRKQIGFDLGDEYPFPIVNHPEARERALSAYDQIK